jgi:hypothetical protein
MGNVDPLPGNRLGRIPAAAPGSGAEHDLPQNVSALLRITLDLLVAYEELGDAIRLAEEDPSAIVADDGRNLRRYSDLRKQIDVAVTGLAKQRPLTIDDRAAYLEVIERTACFYTESLEFIALIRAAQAEIPASGTIADGPRGTSSAKGLRRFLRFWRRPVRRKEPNQSG